MNAESINRNTLFVNDSIDSKASVGEDNDQTLVVYILNLFFL
jgi:hypothetical protein